VWDFEEGMPLLSAYWAAAESVDPERARLAAGDDVNPWCTPAGLGRLWRDAGLESVETGELSASAEYTGFDDAWWSFAAGVSPSGAYCRSLDEERRAALREEFRRRLGAPTGPFTLTARAWSVRGRARETTPQARQAIRPASSGDQTRTPRGAGRSLTRRSCLRRGEGRAEQWSRCCPVGASALDGTTG
jgi:hypothetical protein